MLMEFETKIEMMGREYDAMVRYELDPSDGHPLIDAVESGRVCDGWDYDADRPTKERRSQDITWLLYDDQISAMEDEIDGALKAEAAAMDADPERARANPLLVVEIPPVLGRGLFRSRT